MALERATTLVGLDESQRSAFLAKYDDSTNLVQVEDNDITALSARQAMKVLPTSYDWSTITYHRQSRLLPVSSLASPTCV